MACERQTDGVKEEKQQRQLWLWRKQALLLQLKSSLIFGRRFIELLRLEKASKIIKSNRQPKTDPAASFFLRSALFGV